MATKSRASKPAAESSERSNGDSLRWALGLALFFIGIFAAASVIFYIGYWKEDISIVTGGNAVEIEMENPRADKSVDNPCGYAGAWLAQKIVGNSFGLFGIVLPIVVVMLGVRIIRRKFVFNHAVLSSLLVMILGSVSLGYIFGKGWGLFGSGLGGVYGIDLAHQLTGVIGSVGTAIMLIACWILVGVFINRNFINTVNTAGNAVVDKSGKIVDSLRGRDENRAEADKPKDLRSGNDTATISESVTPPSVTPAQSEAGPVVITPQTTATEPVHPAFNETKGEELSIREVEIDTPPTVILEKPEPKEYPTAGENSTPKIGDIEELEQELKRMEQGGVRRVNVGSKEAEQSPENPFVEHPIQSEESVEKSDNDQRVEVFRVEAEPPTQESPFVEVSVEKMESSQAKKSEEGVVVTVEDNEVKTLKESEIDNSLYDPLKDLVYYKKPTPGLLENYPSTSKVTDEEIFMKKNRIEETLKNFGIPIRSIHATSGPTVTLYEIRQAEGVKISKIQGLENDIAQSIEAQGIRIIAPIPGKGTIGIEVPNEHKQIVSMYSSICSPEFQSAKMELPVVIGRTIQNKSLTFDLAKAPHLLVAGATGQGKSVGLNAIITSLLYTKHPAELKFVMIDPKMVEFSTYAGLEKHFLAKMESEEDAIITDPKKAVYTLHALEQEMEERLGLCKKAGARNIVEYNAKFVARRLPPPKGHRYLPYIVVVIDEFADLIMTAKEVERPVMRLAQKARAVGIHLIVATQRPDVKVITGGIKANFPARIAFRVMQMVDSRTIIDQPGAQTLIGRGDMLFTNGGELTRVQCALVETAEVERIVEYISGQQGYPDAYPLPDYAPEGSDSSMGSPMGGDGESGRPMKVDALFAEIARTAVEQGAISVSMIQRNYEVGFNRAGRIMQQLQSAGIVGPQMGAKPRDILFHDLPSLEAKLQDMGLF